MQNEHPILIIEDDADDCEMIQTILHEMGINNVQLCFDNGVDALKYLISTQKTTSLILSDINMPRMNGIELKKAINEDASLRKKSIPFVFLTTSTSKRDINEAYELLVQGFFIKPASMGKMRETLKMIVGYWSTCAHPNSN